MASRNFFLAILLACLPLCGCGGSSATSSATSTTTPLFSAVPLNDLGAGTYKGFTGGLYAGGSNTMPAAHATDGTALANLVLPLDTNGAPSPTGAVVLLSIGLSNTTQEWCCVDPDGAAPNSASPSAWTFMGQAAVDASGVPHATGLNNSTLHILDGAKGGQEAKCWIDPVTALCGSTSEYDRILTNQLAPRGLSEKQVQAVWVKLADEQPTVALPNASADAYVLETYLGQTLRALKVRYPNLKLAFFSSRIYAGYATSTLNPEPYAYESGFAVQFLLNAQSTQVSTGVPDSRAGDLDYRTGKAPWIAWAAYPWASGATPRSDGLAWLPTDFQSDGTHPSQSGQTKVANLLINFFKTSGQTRCWFLQGGTC